ncbi:MAG: hypothetical protein WC462_02530 [archaeon]
MEKRIGIVIIGLILCFSLVFAQNEGVNSQSGIMNSNDLNANNEVTGPQYGGVNNDNNSNANSNGDNNSNITTNEPNKEMEQVQQQITAQRVERLQNAQNEIKDFNSIKELRKTLSQDFVLAAQDNNEFAKEQVRAVKVSIARVLGEAVRQNPTISFDDINGLQQRIIMNTTEILIDSNDTIQARRTIRATIMNNVMEMRNIGESIELVDGNVVAEIKEGSLMIDDNGLFIEEKPIRVTPSKIKTKITKLEKLQLKVNNGVAEYSAEIKNTRNLFGLIPIQTIERARINAETGKVLGYEKPFWSIISTGTDVVQENEEIQ